MGRSKRYEGELQQLNKESVGLAEAVAKLRSFKSVKLDPSIECVLNLGIDPKQAD
jgi:ribosomal protein L1